MDKTNIQWIIGYLPKSFKNEIKCFFRPNAGTDQI